MLRSTLAGLLLAPLITLGADDGPAKAERAKLEGTWVVVKGYGADGEETPPERYTQANHRMTIRGETMTNSTTKGQASFAFHLDPGRSPKEIDMVMRPGAPLRPGIYRLDGDKLEIAWVGSFRDARPMKLVPCPKDSDTRWTYTVYCREKMP